MGVRGTRREPPGGLGLAQAVHEHDDPRGGIGKGVRELGAPGRDLGAVPADLHPERQLVAALDQMVPVEPVQRTQRQRGDRTRCERGVVGVGVGCGQPCAEAPGDAQAAAEALVHRLRDLVVEHSRGCGRRAERSEGPSGDALVHVPHQLAAGGEGLPGDLAHGLDLRPAH